MNYDDERFRAYNANMAKQIFKKLPATEIDPECVSAAFEARVDEHATYLLENPESLEDVDIDALVAIYKVHQKDMLDLGECIHRYFTGLAQEQARTEVEWDLNL